MLHVVAVDKGSDKTKIDKGIYVPNHLFALGIGIPDIGKERIANYMVNTVEFRNYYSHEEDEDE
jgi:hypothetical protein